MIIIFTGVTDALDGYIARKLGATSDIGAYLDVISDFIFILACFLAYTINGWYDPLVLLLIIIMFCMFIGTSGLKKTCLRPGGKVLRSIFNVDDFFINSIPKNIGKTDSTYHVTYHLPGFSNQPFFCVHSEKLRLKTLVDKR